MKIQVKATVEPLYCRTIPRPLRRWLPLIDGYKTRLISQYEVLQPRDRDRALSMKPFVAQAYGAEFEQTSFETVDWAEGENEMRVLFYPRGSGYAGLRVCFKGLDDSDSILNEVGQVHTFKGDVGTDKDVRYYYKPFLIHSLYDITSVAFTGVVTVFTVLLCILTFVLAVLTYRLSVV